MVDDEAYRKVATELEQLGRRCMSYELTLIQYADPDIAYDNGELARATLKANAVA